MSNIKKLLALVLALTMVLSVSAFAGYTVAPYGDAEKVNEDCEVAVQLLYSLDIMKGDDKGNFNPEATITRAEMAKIIYVILNKGEDDLAVNYKGGKIFSDVAVGSWYEGYVNYMAMTKLVQGRPDGTFAPNAPITTAEAAKMLLTAIGYSAENRGYVGAGWDKQVLSDAAIIGLLKDYNYNTTGYAPRQWVAVMVKNALTDALTYSTIAPVIFNGLLTGTNAGYEYVTMGQKYFGLYKWSGVIVANEYADLNDATTLSSGRTQVDVDEKGAADITFKNWSSDLTDIGESRWGYACGTNVMYVGDTGDNTTFSTGAATEIVKKYIDGIKLNDSTEYFTNFGDADGVKEGYETANGEWLKVIDNDDDGYAEYVFVTEFEMTEVTKVAKDDTVFLANGKKSDEYAMSEDVAAGDVVIYTKIDDVEYVEIAATFEGDVDKYTYKTNILTVEGEDYGESGIYVSDDFKAEYWTVIEDADRKTNYIFYQDMFGYIRAYAEPTGGDKEIVLLTDAYYEVNRDGKVYAVEAYLDEALDDYDVKSSKTGIFFDLDDARNNDWGRLIEFEGNTNLARYTQDEDGVLSLYTAKTFYYNNKGAEDGVKTDYVDLANVDVKAGQTYFYGADNKTKIQANKETVYYYVSYDADGDMVIETVVGYKNTYDVVDRYVDIVAMYGIASNIESDSAKAPYWVADVVVIETESPVFNLGTDVVLGYDVVNKTVRDFASLDVIGADAALDNLSVTNVNGYNSFNKGDINVPAFYYNTEDEDGESHIREITSGFAANDIYAVKADRIYDLYEYVVTVEGKTFYYDETTVVYDLTEKSNYVAITAEDDYEDALVIETGYNYIIVTDGDDNVVYAILVETYDDIMVKLYNAVAADAKGTEIDVEAWELAEVKEDAIAALEEYAEAAAAANGCTVEDIQAAVDAEIAKVEAAESVEAVEALVKNDNDKAEFGECIQAIWDAAYAKKAQ